MVGREQSTAFEVLGVAMYGAWHPKKTHGLGVWVEISSEHRRKSRVKIAAVYRNSRLIYADGRNNDDAQSFLLLKPLHSRS